MAVFLLCGHLIGQTDKKFDGRTEDLQYARQSLSCNNVFSLGRVGPRGYIMPNTAAMCFLVSEASKSEAVAIFKEVLEDDSSTVAAKLYSIWGLYLLKDDSYAAYVPKVKGRVLFQSGCMAMEGEAEYQLPNDEGAKELNRYGLKDGAAAFKMLCNEALNKN